FRAKRYKSGSLLPLSHATDRRKRRVRLWRASLMLFRCQAGALQTLREIRAQQASVPGEGSRCIGTPSPSPTVARLALRSARYYAGGASRREVPALRVRRAPSTGDVGTSKPRPPGIMAK